MCDVSILIDWTNGYYYALNFPDFDVLENMLWSIFFLMLSKQVDYVQDFLYMQSSSFMIKLILILSPSAL